MNFISYAQNYEDVMLFRALRGVEHGFYIDVGAQDPVADSVTKAFYERCWHGINIEPAQRWHEKLLADRPRDINLRLAASDLRGKLRFYEVAETGLSTTQAEFATQSSRTGKQVTEYEVECRTLDDICAEHAVEQVHFLKIDVEGAETAVLRGMPLDRIRPWIIVVEAILPNSRTPAWEQWQPLLDAHGYACIYEDGLNRFYLAQEHPELREAFRFPPNVFDDFVDRRAELAVKALTSENERREAALVGLRGLVSEQELQLSARQSEIARQAETLRFQDAEMERLRLEIDRMHGEIDRMHTEIVSASLMLERQREEIRTRDQIIANSTEALRALRTSVSWRVTAPVRGASLGIRSAVRLTGRVMLQMLRPPARMARPLLRMMARVAWLRAMARMLFRGDSRIAKHARLFLFGLRSQDGASEPIDQDRLSRSSRRVLGEIHSVRGKTPRRSG